MWVLFYRSPYYSWTIFLQSGLFEGIADGLNNAKVMLAFVSDEYAESQNCVMEFRFATSILKIPTILAVVGTGLRWRATEVKLFLKSSSIKATFN